MPRRFNRAPPQLEPSRHLLAKAQKNLKLAVAGQNYPEVGPMGGWDSAQLRGQAAPRAGAEAGRGGS
jgi:hypothetical protein